MKFEKIVDLEKIGMTVLPGVEEQIEFFEKLLEAVQAKRGVVFTQTSSSVKLKVCERGSSR